MDLFVNKLRSTVSQVASSVNTIIPGNAIHRDYELLNLRCSQGCPGFTWSIYDAIKRDSASIKASLKDAIGPNLVTTQTTVANTSGVDTDKKLYSVFLFDKKQLDNLSDRTSREVALDHIKRGVTQLTRLRHPAILTVHHPLEESRSSLAFVTEHLFGHLGSILKEQRAGRVEQMKSLSNNLVDLSTDLGPKDSDYKQSSCQLDIVQVKAGLLQVCDGLRFLHQANLLHRNLCLDNIFVDSNNTWKIGGFEFSCNQTKTTTTKTASGPKISADLDILDFGGADQQTDLATFPSLKVLCQTLPSTLSPNWSCSAPEHSNSDEVTFKSDIYSLGIISCGLLGKDMDLVDLSYEYGFLSDTYKRGLHLRELADKLPASIKTIVMKYAAMNTDSRPSLEDYQNLAIFNDKQVQAIRDLDSQYAWDRLKKIDFLNRLRDILPQLSHQIKVNRIARSLFNEFVNIEMVPYALPNILIIAKDSTPSEFKAKIFPNLKGPFRILEPKAVPLMLLDNLVVLADRAKNCLPEFQQSAFTLIQYLLRSDQQMQEKCLLVLPTVENYIDDISMSTIIVPELARLQRETTVQSIRVKTLECLSQLVAIMKEHTIVAYVLPILNELASKDANVVMASVKLVKGIVNNQQVDLSKEILAGKVLPALVPLSVEHDLDLNQFNAIMVLIKLILDRVERVQRALLAKKLSSRQKSSNTLILDNNFAGSNHF